MRKAIHIRLPGAPMNREQGGLPIWDLRPSFRQFTENWRKFTRSSAASEMPSVTPSMSTVVAEMCIKKQDVVCLEESIFLILINNLKRSTNDNWIVQKENHHFVLNMHLFMNSLHFLIP